MSWFVRCDECSTIADTDTAKEELWQELKFRFQGFAGGDMRIRSRHFCDKSCLFKFLDEEVLKLKGAYGIDDPQTEPIEVQTHVLTDMKELEASK